VIALSMLASATAAAAYVGVHHRRPPATRRALSAGTRPAPSPRPGAGTAQVVAVPAPDAPGGLRKVWVYRPGVTDSPSLPVVYFLHGLPGSYHDIASIGGKAMLDRLITSGTIRPFVLAAPDGNSTRAADPEWADSADGGQQIEKFVIGPLRAVVEGDNPRDRAHRSIVGFSMGGYGAMNIGLHHPDVYGAIASIAGYFDTDDESGIFRGNGAVVASNRPDRHLRAAHQVRMLLADAASDSTSVTAGEVPRFTAVLHAAGVQPLVDIQPGGHDLRYLTSELPRALSFLVDGQL
jgi:S-formylglutathione hydrolase FrmB